MEDNAMEKMNKDELRTALIEGKLIDETGTVNAITVNCISGLYTWPLLSEVWDLYLHDAEAMAELQACLNEVYEKGQYDTMVGVLKIMYNSCGLIIPVEGQMIFDCDIQELKEVYLYEFMEDFQDIMYDFQEKTALY